MSILSKPAKMVIANYLINDSSFTECMEQLSVIRSNVKDTNHTNDNDFSTDILRDIVYDYLDREDQMFESEREMTNVVIDAAEKAGQARKILDAVRELESFLDDRIAQCKTKSESMLNNKTHILLSFIGEFMF